MMSMKAYALKFYKQWIYGWKVLFIVGVAYVAALLPAYIVSGLLNTDGVMLVMKGSSDGASTISSVSFPMLALFFLIYFVCAPCVFGGVCRRMCGFFGIKDFH